ncbi:MAG: nucleotidyltransferase domain-containing protein [Anaerolineae bacterium]
MSADTALDAIVWRLIDTYQPERVYLFGSRARGESGPDSDYDILLVVSDDTTCERKRSRLAYRALWDLGAAADVVVMTRTYFEDRLHLRASLPGTVAAEGVLLYAA